MSLASGGPDTPQRKWNSIPDLLRTMSVKVSLINNRGMSCIAKQWSPLPVPSVCKNVY